MVQVGVLDDVLTNVDNVIRKGRLGPGQTVVADLSSGTFKENTQIAKEVGSKAPYEEWLSSSTRLKDLNASDYTRKCLMSSSEVGHLHHSFLCQHAQAFPCRLWHKGCFNSLHPCISVVTKLVYEAFLTNTKACTPTLHLSGHTESFSMPSAGPEAPGCQWLWPGGQRHDHRGHGHKWRRAHILHGR